MNMVSHQQDASAGYDSSVQLPAIPGAISGVANQINAIESQVSRLEIIMERITGQSVNPRTESRGVDSGMGLAASIENQSIRLAESVDRLNNVASQLEPLV